MHFSIIHYTRTIPWTAEAVKKLIFQNYRSINFRIKLKLYKTTVNFVAILFISHPTKLSKKKTSPMEQGNSELQAKV